VWNNEALSYPQTPPSITPPTTSLNTIVDRTYRSSACRELTHCRDTHMGVGRIIRGLCVNGWRFAGCNQNETRTGLIESRGCDLSIALFGLSISLHSQIRQPSKQRLRIIWSANNSSHPHSHKRKLRPVGIEPGLFVSESTVALETLL
jgi:hypothetical protein